MSKFANTFKLSKNYSKSLFELALCNKSLGEVEQDFELFTNLLAESKEFSNILNSDLLPLSLKLDVAEAILKKIKTSELFKKFVYLLIDKKRVYLINDIQKFYKKRMNDHSNIVEVDLVLADIKSSSIVEELKKLIENKLSKEVKVNIKENKEILGGFALKINSNLIDASLINNVKSLKDISQNNINNFLN
jgi:F-type H+-transporting ATPase subunit delta